MYPLLALENTPAVSRVHLLSISLSIQRDTAAGTLGINIVRSLQNLQLRNTFIVKNTYGQFWWGGFSTLLYGVVLSFSVSVVTMQVPLTLMVAVVSPISSNNLIDPVRLAVRVCV